MNTFTLSNTSLTRLDGVEERGKILVKMALSLSPIDFGIAFDGGKRSDAKQMEIFKTGNSKCDGVTTKSKHQLGKAIDFVPIVNNKVSMGSHNYYIIIGAFFAAAKSLGLEITSGANWDNDGEFITDQTFQDLGHIEWK